MELINFLFLLAGIVWITSALRKTNRNMDEIRGEIQGLKFLLKTLIDPASPGSSKEKEKIQPETALKPETSPAKSSSEGKIVSEPPKASPAQSPSPLKTSASPPSHADSVHAPDQIRKPAEPVTAKAVASSERAALVSNARKAPSAKAEEPGEFERRANEILRKMWNWICVGEEFRNPNVSTEYAVATTWLMRIGVLIFLTGMSFLLKYSIDNNLIGPSGRVALSILTACIMTGGGFWISGKKYKVVGVGLVGAGIATFYFSIFASFALYKLTGLPLSFGLMILITAAAGIFALRLNSLFVAIAGVIGGYLTPLLLSTGSANIPGLFSYLLLLGACVIFIAGFRDWKILNFFAFVFTYGLVISVLGTKYEAASDFAVAMSFLCAFFILFSATSMLYNLVHGKKSSVLTLLGIVANSTVFFAIAYSLVSHLYGNRWVSAVTISLAVFYLSQTYYFIAKRTKDRNLLIILIGISSVYITLTIPILLSPEWVTAAWSIQAFVFMWMSYRTGSNFVRVISYLLYLIAFARFASIDFGDSFIHAGQGADSYLPKLWDRFLSLGSLILSCVCSYFTIRKGGGEAQAAVDRANDTGDFVPASGFATALAAFVAFAIFVYLHFEVFYLSRAFYPPIQMTLMTFIWLAAIALAVGTADRTGKKTSDVIVVVLLCGLAVKFIIFDFIFWDFSFFRFTYSTCGYEISSIMRLMSYIPTMILFGWLCMLPGTSLSLKRAFGSLSLVLLFFYLTLEVNTFFGIFAPGFKTGAVTILWSLIAISFVLGGIMGKKKILRMVALILFVVVAVKIFFFDIAGMGQLARIIASITLGAIVIVGAVIYVRFKDFFELKNDTGTK